MIGGLTTIRGPALTTPLAGVTLLSDLHLGCAFTDVGRIRAECQRAVEDGDRIVVNGDVFDLILPTDSKRYQSHVVAEEFRGVPDVVDKLVEYATDLLWPYAENLDLLGVGNHDDVSKYHHTDPVLRVVNNLNERLKGSSSDHRVRYGGYCGFLTYPLGEHNRNKRYNPTFSMFYHHGFGGGSALSGAAADFNKVLAMVEGVDVIWLGHKHQKTYGHMQRLLPPNRGEDHPRVRQVRFVRTGAYLVATKAQTQESVMARGRQSLYSVDKGYPFSGLGGARLVIDSTDPRDVQIKVTQ